MAEFEWVPEKDGKVTAGRILLFRHDAPDCVIEISKNGRIVFLPKKEGEKVPPFAEMKPGAGFWDGLSALLNNMEDEIASLRGKVAITKAECDVLRTDMNHDREVFQKFMEDMPEKKKFVYTGTNKRQAFFAGLAMGRKESKGG